MSGLDTSALDAIIEKLNKEYEDNPIRLGDDYERVWRVPTGSHELDWILSGDPVLGYGFPIGKHTRFYGQSYSGKTLSSLNIIREGQNIHITTNNRLTALAMYLQSQGRSSDADMILEKRDKFLQRFPEGMIAVYYNVEKQYSKDLAKAVGIDTSKLYVSEGTMIEGIGEKMQGLMGSAHLHVIDSASVAEAAEGLAGEFTDKTVGLKARVWGSTWGKVKEHFDIENNAIIQIDQTRTKIQMTGKRMSVTNEPAGGQQVTFAADLTLEFRKASQLYYDTNNILVDDPAKAKTIDTMSGDREADGIESVIKVQKSRVCKPFTTARVRIDTEKGAKYDESYELFKGAKRYGVLENKGAWYYLLDDNGDRVKDSQGDDIKWQGKATVQDACVNDPDLKKRILDVWFNQPDQLEIALEKAHEDK